jgi:hypothetical protein
MAPDLTVHSFTGIVRSASDESTCSVTQRVGVKARVRTIQTQQSWTLPYLRPCRTVSMSSDIGMNRATRCRLLGKTAFGLRFPHLQDRSSAAKVHAVLHAVGAAL